MKVGRYAIKRLLGRGGFGEVYLGFDEQLQRDVAIKLTFGSIVGPKATRMFMAEALQYAHSKGLIHRNIKPANILLDETDHPYLADFGIALRETDQVGSGEITGTPAYMSPEQARGEGHLMSNQCDIYSLGLVLYGEPKVCVPPVVFPFYSSSELASSIAMDRWA